MLDYKSHIISSKTLQCLIQIITILNISIINVRTLTLRLSNKKARNENGSQQACSLSKAAADIIRGTEAARFPRKIAVRASAGSRQRRSAENGKLDRELPRSLQNAQKTLSVEILS